MLRFQVSNWFINARVRLWKPMVEEMYQQETKEEDTLSSDQERSDHQQQQQLIRSSRNNINNNQNSSTSGHHQQHQLLTQNPTPNSSTTAATQATTTPTPQTTITTTATATRSDINAIESDPSLVTINRQTFSENQAMKQQQQQGQGQVHQQQRAIAKANPSSSELVVAPPVSQSFAAVAEDTCRRGSMVAAGDFGTISSSNNNHNINIGADHHSSSGTLIAFGTTTTPTAGDVSLTLGLRHAGNMPENTTTSPFSVRDFGS